MINLTDNIKLSKTQLHKIRQSGGLLGRRLGPLKWTVFNENVLKPLAKSVRSNGSNRRSYS